MPHVELTKELQPVPGILADREQFQSVVTNLLLNARDAVGREAAIQVRTEHRDGRVVLSVADNGCGMSPEFLKDSLFRPFQTTKKNGLGIGMFQVPDDRRGPPGQHRGGERGRQGHDLSREPPARVEP